MGAKWHTRACLHKLGSDPNLALARRVPRRPHPTRTLVPCSRGHRSPAQRPARPGARPARRAGRVRLAHGGRPVLYVGKAASLRSASPRTSRASTAIARARSSSARAASIEPIVVASASEALLLEQQLIKRHRPPLNVRLRDDKSYPYIAVTLADEYPRVLFTRERHRTRRPLLRPVRVGAEGARRRSRRSTRSSRTGPARGRRPGGARACRASITTSAAAQRPASG